MTTPRHDDWQQLRGDVPLRNPFEATCLLCGRVTESFSLTADDLLHLRPRPRCTFCGGSVQVQPSEVGYLPSAIRGRMVTDSRTLPMGAAGR